MLVGKGDPIRSATDVRILYAYTYRIANSFQIISAWPVIWERIPEGIPGMGSGGGVSYYYTDVRPHLECRVRIPLSRPTCTEYR